MNNLGTIELETPRLRLRRFKQGDCGAVFSWASDPEVTKHMRFKTHTDIKAAESWVSYVVGSYGLDTFYDWAIELKNSGQVVGSFGMSWVLPMADQVLDIGYCISRKHWGCGIAAEAGKAVLQFAFEQLGANRVEAVHSTENPASGRVMDKMCMHREGYMKSKYVSGDGTATDCIGYAISKSQYLKEDIGFNQLIDRAKAVLGYREFSQYASGGQVAAAILTDKGNVYTGVCLDMACSVGFCAEHNAAAAMVTAGENRIIRVVAINKDGVPIAPCGRCREFMWQLHPDNPDMQVMVEGEQVVTLRALVPHPWC